MHITIAALGTRGDVQPYLALALGLQSAGHTVRIIAGDNFRDWVSGYGFEFAGSGDAEAMMHTPEALKWVDGGRNPIGQLFTMRKVLEKHADQYVKPILKWATGTDLLLTGFIAEPFIQSVSEKFGTPYLAIPLQPYQATRSSSASIMTVTRRESRINRWVGVASEHVLFSICGGVVNDIRQSVGLSAHTFSSYRRDMFRAPRIYGVSPHVIPRPKDWTKNSHIVGYWFLDQPDWQPPQDLQEFLDAGDPPVYVGFGSMSGSNPEVTFHLICDALRLAGRRGVISVGWSRAKLNQQDHVYVLSSAPHDWLFPRMSAIVHHGGAGTTGASCRSGKPTMVIPHFTDQPYWGRRVYELGVGVKPIPRHRLTVEKLAHGITQLTTDPEIIERAALLGEAIRAEDGIARAVELIEHYANVGVRRI